MPENSLILMFLKIVIFDNIFTDYIQFTYQPSQYSYDCSSLAYMSLML